MMVSRRSTKKTLASFNMSLGLFDDILHSSINFLQDSFDGWGSSSNLSINNSLDFFQEIHDVVLDFSRFNLGLDLVKNVLQILGSFHDVNNGEVFLGLELVSQVSKVLADGGDEVLNGMLEGGFEDMVEEIIEDVVAGNVVLELTNLGHDGLKKVDQKTLSSFDMMLGLFFDEFHSSINLFQDSLDSRGSSSNLSINNSLDFVQKVHDIILNFSRFNLGLDLVKNVLQILSSFHDVNDGKVFLGLELVSQVSKVLANGGDEVLNGMLEGGFEDIIEEIIEDVVAGNVVLKLTDLGHDGLKKVNQKTLSSFNMSLGLFFDEFHSSINFFQDSLDGGGSSSDL